MIRPVPCWARLMRFCQRKGRSREDAEDLIQTALLRLEEYCRTAETKVRNPEQFLAKTVRNLIVDQIRHERVVSYASQPVEQFRDTGGRGHTDRMRKSSCEYGMRLAYNTSRSDSSRRGS